MVPHCQDRTQWYTTSKLANNSSTNFFLSHIDNSYRMNTSNTSKCGVEIVSQWFLLPEFPVWVSCYQNTPGIQVESTWDVNLPLDMILHLKELCSFISKKIYYWRQDYKSISLGAIAKYFHLNNMGLGVLLTIFKFCSIHFWTNENFNRVNFSGATQKDICSQHRQKDLG